MEPGLSRRMVKTLNELLPAFAVGAPPEQHDASTPAPIDLSRALNEVIHPELLEFFTSTVEDKVTSEAFAAPVASLNGGDPRLREALAAFFNTYFNAFHAVKPEHIVLTAGATDAIENVIHAVCDDGDSVLIPGPHWPGFEPILKRKANVNIILAQPPTYSHWDNYLLPSLQAAYDFSAEKSRIKAVLLCNPNDPLSTCYPRDTLLELMEFCQERGLHFICDECHALTGLNGVDAKSPKFVSALSLAEPLVPQGAVKVDPSCVHVIWSASKLFGMSGFKVGCIVSQQNPHLLTAMALLASHPSSISTLYLSNLLSWSQLPTLLALNSERLTQSCHILASSLRRWNLEFVTPTHGLFLFAKLAKGAKSAEDEQSFYDRLAVHGVKVAQGRFYKGVDKDFGWARIRFSVSLEVMREAMGRMEGFFT
ncbi:PLP-dependent transferase [Clathrospora elynae]|uniref:PLP-dependent transferase n=1 Tax=Clathrospora elynae TaxID=706981 RepID=A0A6A5SZD3_9PLEO|nr:PLP-dependent transferase [Clathrospora elynae]